MLKALLLPVVLLAASCSPPASEPAASSETSSMSEAAVAGPIAGMGTVTAIDPAAGTINLDHEAIAAIAWPAMSMQFTAENPAILQGIAVGDRVSFELKSASESSVVTAVQKQ